MLTDLVLGESIWIRMVGRGVLYAYKYADEGHL